MGLIGVVAGAIDVQNEVQVLQVEVRVQQPAGYRMLQVKHALTMLIGG